METLIKAKRESLGLSQRGLASKAGIAYKTLQLMEAGAHDVRWSTMLRLGKALGCTRAKLESGVRQALGVGAATIAELSARLLDEGEDGWRLWLPEFLDEFQRDPGAARVEEAPRPGLSHPLHALLAGVAEALCARERLPAPWWCAGVPPLDEPWFVAGAENLKASALVESPAWFRRRNIFVLGNFLERA